MRKFAVFDFDGTLIRWQLYHAIADELARAGYIDKFEFDEVKNARLRWKKRVHEESFSQYQTLLVHTFEKTLAKLTTTEYDSTIQNVFNEYKDQVYTYTRDLITALKNQGYFLLAISGSQIEIVSKIAKYYGFDDYTGIEYERSGKKFTGKSNLIVSSKDKILLDMMIKHDLELKGSIAVGDSESDVPMLEMVEKPIAFNPTHRLFEYAKTRSWEVIVERKNVIYKLEPKDGKYILA